MDAPPPEMPDFHVADLSSLTLAGSGRRRSIRVPRAQRAEGFAARYDFDTLVYDAVRVGGDAVLVAPRLYNLAPLLPRLTLDGRSVRLRSWRAHRRHEVARLAAPAGASRLALTLPGWEAACGISPDGAGHFAGLNASLHISRDNRLAWLSDWARWHVGEHGLEAMLVMDNASAVYPPEAILEALAGTGLRRAVVLRVPQPYGPQRSRVGPGAAKFLQPAMLNLARLRYLRRARAVLNVDIDELVWSRAGSVFDLACASRLGHVSFKGAWRMPGRDGAHLRHADHGALRARADPCPPKYCIVPGGPLGRLSWDVHRLEGPLGLGAALTQAAARPDIGYWHCRAITTDWKGHRRTAGGGRGAPDPATEAALARVFGG